MIIHSKFQDYYDSALIYGHDATSRYIRKTVTVEQDNRKNWFSDYFPEFREYRSYPFYIGFCGTIYPGVTLEYTNADLRVYRQTFWSGEALEHYIHHISDKTLRASMIKQFARQVWTSIFDGKLSRKWLSYTFFTHRDQDEHFFALGTPIFKITPTETISNPGLKQLEFFKIFGPVQAFQEIDMYLSGVLGGRHPLMTEISDLSKRNKKGFDDWSFKTRPTKHLRSLP